MPADDGPSRERQALTAPSLEAHWLPAMALALVLGGLFALLVGDGAPVPLPVDDAAPAYWIGWSPLIGLAVLLYLLVVSGDARRRSAYGLGAALILLGALIASLTAWNRTDDVAILTAIHLPFAVWMTVGWTVSRQGEAGDQFYGYLLKSVETIVTAGLYLIAGGIFAGLTFGIFSVLGVELPAAWASRVPAFGIGLVPLLALASVYAPHQSPVMQDWSRGLARLVRLLPRLMMPAAIGILLIYLLWFVPTRFSQPFDDRSALVVYNASIMAIIAVMSAAITGIGERLSGRYDRLLRYSILALCLLSLLLNAYALGAIASRIIDFGLTPNRHAVGGWNIVTLALLAVLFASVWRADAGQWASRFRRVLPRLLVLATAWSVWILLVLPHV